MPWLMPDKTKHSCSKCCVVYSSVSSLPVFSNLPASICSNVIVGGSCGVAAGGDVPPSQGPNPPVRIAVVVKATASSVSK